MRADNFFEFLPNIIILVSVVVSLINKSKKKDDGNKKNTNDIPIARDNKKQSTNHKIFGIDFDNFQDTIKSYTKEFTEYIEGLDAEEKEELKSNVKKINSVESEEDYLKQHKIDKVKFQEEKDKQENDKQVLIDYYKDEDDYDGEDSEKDETILNKQDLLKEDVLKGLIFSEILKEPPSKEYFKL